MADPTTMREMAAEITAALGKMGIGGRVVVRDGAAELHSAPGAEVVAIDLAEQLDQWALLPPEIRARRAEALAQRLRNAARGQLSPVAVQSKPFPLAKVATVAAVLVLGAVVVGWLRISGFFGRGAPEESVVTPETAATASASASATVDPGARVERACEAARSRMRAGASMGVDIDGWVVELWLAREPGKPSLAELPVLKAAIEGGAAREVAPPKPFEVKQAEPPRDEIGADQALLRYGGGFVTRFFSVEGRQALVDHARVLATGSNAHYAALYARCAHLPYNDVGAWYSGRNATGAAVALLYAAGTFAEPAALDVGKLNERGMPLDALEQALITGQIDAAGQVRMVGGRIAPDNRSYTFALGGPTLAVKASHTIAEKLKL